jgi:hypothetical protein
MTGSIKSQWLAEEVIAAVAAGDELDDGALKFFAHTLAGVRFA